MELLKLDLDFLSKSFAFRNKTLFYAGCQGKKKKFRIETEQITILLQNQ